MPGGVPSTIAAGEVAGFHTEATPAVPGVPAVIIPGEAPWRGGRAELAVSQSRMVSFRGQSAALVATMLEAPRGAGTGRSMRSVWPIS